MNRTMKAPAIALVLATAFISAGCTVFDTHTRSTYRQGPVRTFDPLSLPKDGTAREPFLDPTALFSDQVYVVRPLHMEAEGSAHNARFVGGEQAMVGYLKTQVLQHIAPGIGWLKPPVLHFQVDAMGAPTQVELVKTSGNADLDVALVRIFRQMPRWVPATDARGLAVAQAFQFVVGSGGC
ncbi:MAG: energy transducer TonB [Flavobacteriales bacterium]|nr:energy transducer TonB [Flavobacteriales bacterium]MBP6697613.1 energy transducer TonB [Flavobacteriales bacterium]